MKYKLLSRTMVTVSLATMLLVVVILGSGQTEASHPSNSIVKPVNFSSEQAAYFSPAVTAHIRGHIVDGMTYWNGVAQPHNSYNTTLTAWTGVNDYDLFIDAKAPGGETCVLDTNHCIILPTTDTPAAQIIRFADINISILQWNLNDPEDGTIDFQSWHTVLARHELGHDNYLADHSTSYWGLMCNADTCTRSATLTLEEKPSSNDAFLTRPSPPIDVQMYGITNNSISVQWFLPPPDTNARTGFRFYRSQGGYANWVLAATSTNPNLVSYTYTGLTLGTLYCFSVRTINSWGGGPAFPRCNTTTGPTPPPASVGGIAEQPDLETLSSGTAGSENRDYTWPIVAGMAVTIVLTIVAAGTWRLRRES